MCLRFFVTSYVGIPSIVLIYSQNHIQKSQLMVHTQSSPARLAELKFCFDRRGTKANGNENCTPYITVQNTHSTHHIYLEPLTVLLNLPG